MKYVLVKDGARTPSTFSDFVELVNHQDDVPPVGFFQQSPPGLRLVRNRTEGSVHPFAITYYHSNPTSRVQHPQMFIPLEIDVMERAAEKYDFVMVGVVTAELSNAGHHTLAEVRYVSRTSQGQLVDARTDLPVDDASNLLFMTTLLGFVRVKGFPVHYLIVNPDLIRVTDGFDYYDYRADTLWMLLSERDGNIRARMFTPHVSNARLIDTTIIASSTFQLRFFDDPCSILRNESIDTILKGAAWTVTTDLQYTVEGGAFNITAPAPGRVAFFEVEFHCGHFFDVASLSERLTFKYVVLGNANS